MYYKVSVREHRQKFVLSRPSSCKYRFKKSEQGRTAVSGLVIVYTYIYNMFARIRSAATPTSLGLLPRLQVQRVAVHGGAQCS